MCLIQKLANFYKRVSYKMSTLCMSFGMKKKHLVYIAHKIVKFHILRIAARGNSEVLYKFCLSFTKSPFYVNWYKKTSKLLLYFAHIYITSYNKYEIIRIAAWGNSEVLYNFCLSLSVYPNISCIRSIFIVVKWCRAGGWYVYRIVTFCLIPVHIHCCIKRERPFIKKD